MNIPSHIYPPSSISAMTNDSRFPDTKLTDSSSVSFFANAHDFTLNNPVFEVIMHAPPESKPRLRVLYERVAMNAILNDKGRADGANIKCHRGTREKVVEVIQWWMDGIDSPRIYWLNAPMGGGKTAIMKTIQEMVAMQGVHHAISFFFFRGDPTRNRLNQFFPTLLYQLSEIHQSSASDEPASAEKHRHLNDAMETFLTTYPLILEESIARQCKLLTALIPDIRQLLPTAHIILLVDGLDECDADTNAHEDQCELLRALEGLVAVNNSPFRLLIASRPEPHIKMAFNQLELPPRTTFLNEDFNPKDDIRTVVISKFDTIKRTHPEASSLLPDWPSPTDVDDIVAKSSGQFIYADTVMRYIGKASALPSLSLQQVQGIVQPFDSPFGHIDSMYALILSQVAQEKQQATRDVLSMDILLKGLNLDHSIFLSIVDVLQLYDPRYSKSVVEDLVSALPAIAELAPTGYLKYYHASLPEFLENHTRSGDHCIDLDSFRAKLLEALWDKPPIQDSSIVLNLQVNLFRELNRPTPNITDWLLNMPFPAWMTPTDSWTKFGDSAIIQLESIQYLYFENDYQIYQRILKRFIHMLWSQGWKGRVDRIPDAKRFLDYYRRCGWTDELVDNFSKKIFKTRSKS